MKKIGVISSLLVGCSVVAFGAAPAPGKGPPGITLEELGTYASGVFDGSAAEIVAHDPRTQRLFVVNAANATVDVLDIEDPSDPTLEFAIDATEYGAVVNSVDVRKDVVAAAVEADPSQEPGSVVFFDTDGEFLSEVKVGALPDMLTFTPDGTKVVVANEGEPAGYCEGTEDPEGSVSIIDVRGKARNVKQSDVKTATFTSFNGRKDELRASGVRIFGPGATIAQDLEPEYVAVSTNSSRAWVALQENNALAIVDLDAARVKKIVPLGLKDHWRPRNGFDASDEDGAINITSHPTSGMYMPDGIDSFRVRGRDVLIMANEGDAREYDCYGEEARVADLELDPQVFPNAAELQQDDNLGRLKTTTTSPTNDEGQYTEIYSFGARSFSIRNARGRRLFDSGKEFEKKTAALLPDEFNSNNDENDSFDTRSDDKGPEPEGVDVGRVAGRTYAFIGLERVGGVMVYDVSRPANARFVDYATSRDFDGDPAAGTAGDLGPEGILFIPRNESSTHKPLVVVANEVSGTTTIYEVRRDKR
jgi:hypothetical protein